MNPSPYPVPFKSAHVRARIVKILLIVGAIAAGMSFFTEALSFAFPPLTEEQELGDNPAGAVIMLVMFLIALLELTIYVATVVFFLVWLYRAHDNLRGADLAHQDVGEYGQGLASLDDAADDLQRLQQRITRRFDQLHLV